MAGRRPRQVRHGIDCLQCHCDIHEGKWLPEEAFGWYRAGERRYRRTLCREGYALYHAKRRFPDKELHGWIPASYVRRWVLELVHHCGGYNAAARYLGVRGPSVLRWAGRTKHGKLKWVQRQTAARILQAVYEVRHGVA